MELFCRTIDETVKGIKTVTTRKRCARCKAMLESKTTGGTDAFMDYGAHELWCPMKNESFYYKLGYERGRSVAMNIEWPSPDMLAIIAGDLAASGYIPDNMTALEMVATYASMQENDDRNSDPFTEIAAMIKRHDNHWILWDDFERGVKDAIAQVVQDKQERATR